MFAFEAKQPPQPYFALGNAVVDIVGGTVFLNGGPAVRLEPKTIHVLAVLAANINRVVRRGDLLDAVWGTMPVGDEVLSRHASLLRKVLQRVLSAPEGLETIRKSGYRLNAKVRWMEHYSPSSAQASDQIEALELLSLPAYGPGGLDNLVAQGVLEDLSGTDEPPFDPSTGLSIEIRKDAPKRSLFAGKVAAIAGLVVTVVAALVASVWFLSKSSSEILTPESTRRIVGLDKYMRLNANTALDVFPDVAPGGGLIAFVRLSDQGTRSAIMLQSLGDTNEHELVAADAKHYYPRFSPDGGYLGYVRVQGNTCVLMRVPVSGGLPRRMAACPDATPVSFDWAPDVSALLVSALGKGVASRLAEIDMETGKMSFLKDAGGQDITGRDPRYGHSRNEVFFLGAEGGSRLMRVFRDTGVVETVSHGLGDYDSFAYVEGARLLVATVKRNGKVWTEVINAQDGSIIDSASTPGIFPAASRRTPEGYVVVAYMHYASDSKLFETRVDPETPDAPLVMHQLLTSQAEDTDPVYAIDGNSVYFASNRSGAYELWAGDPRTGLTVQLTDLDADYLEFINRSRDGRQLLLTQQKAGRYGLLKVDITSPNKVHIQAFADKSVAQAMAGRFSPDGRWVYFAGKSRSGSGWRAFRADLSTDPLALHPKPISLEGLTLTYPLNAEEIILGRTGGNGLWRYAPGTGKIEDLLPQWQFAEAISYAQHLYYFERPYKTGASGARFCRLAVATANTPECFGMLDPAPFTVTGFDLRPDSKGLRVVMSAVSRIEGDIWYSRLELGGARQ